MEHILVGSSFSRQVWQDCFSWCYPHALAPTSSVRFLDWWHGATSAAPTALRKGIASLILLVAWLIWKHRNSCVFDGTPPSTSQLLHEIKEEARSWAKAGASGLATLLP